MWKDKRLKKCMCGSRFIRVRAPMNHAKKVNGVVVDGHWVECFDCGRNGKTEFSQEKAIESWNNEIIYDSVRKRTRPFPKEKIIIIGNPK